MSKIYLVPNKANGNKLFTTKEGSNQVSVRLMMPSFTIGKNGGFFKGEVSCITNFPQEAVEMWCNMYVKGSTINSVSETPRETSLDGVIQRRLSFEPQFRRANGELQESRINPNTKEEVLVDGKPTYLQTVYQGSGKSEVWGKVEISEKEGKEVFNFITEAVEAVVEVVKPLPTPSQAFEPAITA